MSEVVLPGIAGSGKNEREEHCQGDCHCHHDHCGEAKIEEIDEDELKGVSDTRSIYRIINMDCPMEEQLIRKKLATVKGVRGLEFNLMRRTLAVEHEPGVAANIVSALKSIDMKPQILGAANAEKDEAPESREPWKRLIWACVIAAFSEIAELWLEYGQGALMADSGPAIYGYSVWKLLPLVLSLISIAVGGLIVFRKGWIALSSFNLNINTLMTVAVIGALCIGQFPEAAMVMALFNISEALEARALDRTRKAIKDLMNLAPETAEVLYPDGTRREKPVGDIAAGSVISARPGQKIALDGVVAKGTSSVNQAPVTGESIPVEKAPGDTVFAGTLNETGFLEIRTTALASDTTLARIIRAVEEAQATKAPVQRFVDEFARYYTPAIFAFAILWALFAPLALHHTWHESIYTGLVILVIGCPCALVISTPIAIVSALASAARKGILVKGGAYLELGRRLTRLALDKTGTITFGRPELTDAVILDESSPDEILAIAAALATKSDHPVSMGIARAAREKNIATPEASDIRALPGMGIEGSVDNSKWSLGNLKLAESLGGTDSDLIEKVEALESRGKTAVILLNSEGAKAIFAVADTVKPSSIEAIRDLAGLGVETIMLTGDNKHAARAIAKESGVSDFRAELLPKDKLQIIETLEKEGVAGMVGDGINDAPALAKADIGFAMGKTGTDTAIETADVALMDDDLRKIPAFIRLSRSARKILVENISVALGIKAAFFALTLAGLATMWMAVFADVGATLIVVANGLRLTRQ